MSHTIGPVLGLIPAKGGSTRLRRKNILPVGGKSLLEWTVDAALESGVLDRLVLSTEDDEIARLGRDAGADVPFMRPPELARDPAGVVDVALHALGELSELGEHYTTLVILLPTCPLRGADDIRAATRLFAEKQASFLMSVGPYDHTPFAALQLDKDGLLHPYFPEFTGRKGPEMPAAFRPNGAIHVLDVEAFRRERSYFAQPLVAYVMPAERSVDIDSAMDLAVAEAVYRTTRTAGEDE